VLRNDASLNSAETAAPVSGESMTGLEAFGGDGLSALFAATPDSILIVDEAGMIRAANTSAERSFSYPSGHLLNLPVSVLMTPDDRVRHVDYLRASTEARRARILGIAREVEGLRRDGSCFPMHVNVGEFLHDGDRFFVAICHDITEEREHQREVRRLATYDDLTGALNRTTAVSMLHSLLAQVDLEQTDALAVIFIDLSNFKQINDRFGHAVGDEVLRVIAQRFAAQIRGADLLARVGGDEFLAVVQTQGDAGVAQRVAERLSAVAQEPISIERNLLVVSANIGISLFPADGADADALIVAADIAMYEAKRARETAPRRFSAGLRDERVREFDLRGRMATAIDRHELVLHYQPQIDMRTGRVVGLEALVRWQDPEHGLRTPDQFLPIIATAGLHAKLTPYVLDLACRENAQLIASGILDVPVAVNVTSACFASRHFVPQVEEALESHGLAADRLEIELAETAPTGALSFAPDHARVLQSLGVMVAMDDFGTGYSSIARLREHQFGTLKIDRAFISGAAGTSTDTALITGMLAIARGLSMRTIAEGVETEGQRDVLLAAGCRLGQGWLYAPAMPMAELRAWLQAPAVPAPRLPETSRTPA